MKHRAAGFCMIQASRVSLNHLNVNFVRLQSCFLIMLTAILPSSGAKPPEPQEPDCVVMWQILHSGFTAFKILQTTSRIKHRKKKADVSNWFIDPVFIWLLCFYTFSLTFFFILLSRRPSQHTCGTTVNAHLRLADKFGGSFVVRVQGPFDVVLLSKNLVAMASTLGARSY